MPMGTGGQVALLVKLQQIETESKKIRSRLRSIPGRMDALDAQIRDFEQKAARRQSDLQEMNQKYRTLDSDLQLNLGRIRKSEEKLGAVKTNKEYQSSLKEIEDLKAMNSKLEDEILACLDEIEAEEKELARINAEHSEIAQQIDREKEALRKEAQQDEQLLVGLESEHSEIADQIDPALLEKFNRTQRQQADGIAIVAVKDAVCQGCNMNIPPQMYNELHRSDTLGTCPLCERLIFWQEN